MEYSLDSLLNQIDSSYEIIVIDNMSDDGTEKILQKYSKEDNVKIKFRKCTRGMGRKVGVTLASGDYVISHLDCDEKFKPLLNRFVNIYHNVAEGYLLTIKKDKKIAFYIAPRSLILKIGNYNDLNYHEDRDLYWRAVMINKFAYYKTNDFIVSSHKMEAFISIKRVIHSTIDSFRINDFPPSIKKINLWLPFILLMSPVFLIISRFYEQYKNDKAIRRFNIEHYQINA